MSKGKSPENKSLNDTKIIHFFHFMNCRKVILIDKMKQDCYHFILDFHYQESLIKFSSMAYNYLRHVHVLYLFKTK